MLHSSGIPALRMPSQRLRQVSAMCDQAHLTVRLGLRRRASATADIRLVHRLAFERVGGGSGWRTVCTAPITAFDCLVEFVDPDASVAALFEFRIPPTSHMPELCPPDVHEDLIA